MLPDHSRAEAQRRPPPADLAEALARAAEKCSDPQLRRWAKRLAEGEHADSDVSESAPTA
jgi:hypothetical protein